MISATTGRFSVLAAGDGEFSLPQATRPSIHTAATKIRINSPVLQLNRRKRQHFLNVVILYRSSVAIENGNREGGG